MVYFDVIIIGGGHAGVEAAAAAARRRARVLLLTKSKSDLGAMSCNPSLGGPGKSQMIAEIDAFGGIMPTAADMSGIHFRLLNATHGPATQALRVQIDRNLYRKSITYHLSLITNLTIIYESVETLDLQNKIVNGKYSANAIVITTGTFLNGLIHRGAQKTESGRLQDDNTYQSADKNISGILRDNGFDLIRLKTGTPARIYRDSVNFDGLEIQPGDETHDWFSVTKNEKQKTKNDCFITYTTEETHRVIRDNIKDAPMYNGEIVGIGPRYCPSLEDKVMRFPEHKSHHVFLEPEGTDSDLIYPNGISTSMSAETQDKWIRTIRGLENCRIERFGYAIEYDAIDARALKQTLESKNIPGVFFAGQICGTSGYEEAAAQGLVAGANAAAYAAETSDKKQVISDKNTCHSSLITCLPLNRTNSIIGVMIDDITTMGIDEPYRMFTSRAEYRLSLRSDNAITRLGQIAENLNLITRERHHEILNLKSEIINKNDRFYAGYIARNAREIESYKRDADLKIPSGFDYNLSGLTNELIQKLNKTHPENIAQLSRIPGMTPAGIMIVVRKIKTGNS